MGKENLLYAQFVLGSDVGLKSPCSPVSPSRLLKSVGPHGLSQQQCGMGGIFAIPFPRGEALTAQPRDHEFHTPGAVHTTLTLLPAPLQRVLPA